MLKRRKKNCIYTLDLIGSSLAPLRFLRFKLETKNYIFFLVVNNIKFPDKIVENFIN